jgi:hypothetical protein
MSRAEEIERRFHEEWLGMVQPSGLVVSIPVLLDAQCFQRNPPALQQKLRQLAPDGLVADTTAFFAEVLDLPAERLDRGDALPRDLAHYHERQAVTPTSALKRVAEQKGSSGDDLVPDIATPATRPKTSTRRMAGIGRTRPRSSSSACCATRGSRSDF